MASSSLGGGTRHVKFVALACGGRLLASHTHWNAEAQEDYAETLKQIFASAGWVAIRAQAKTKLELKSGSNVYCMELDGERVYCAVVTAGYPIRAVFSAGGGGGGGNARLMREFAEHVHSQERVARESALASTPAGGLQRTLARFLAALAARFDDIEASCWARAQSARASRSRRRPVKHRAALARPLRLPPAASPLCVSRPPPAQSLDKLTKVGGQLKTLQATMAKNLVLADERHTLLDRELDKTAELAASARLFSSRATAMKRIMCCRSVTATLAVVGVVLVVIAAIILILNYTKFHWWN